MADFDDDYDSDGDDWVEVEHRRSNTHVELNFSQESDVSTFRLADVRKTVTKVTPTSVHAIAQPPPPPRAVPESTQARSQAQLLRSLAMLGKPQVHEAPLPVFAPDHNFDSKSDLDTSFSAQPLTGSPMLFDEPKVRPKPTLVRSTIGTASVTTKRSALPSLASMSSVASTKSLSLKRCALPDTEEEFFGSQIRPTQLKAMSSQSSQSSRAMSTPHGRREVDLSQSRRLSSQANLELDSSPNTVASSWKLGLIKREPLLASQPSQPQTEDIDTDLTPIPISSTQISSAKRAHNEWLDFPISASQSKPAAPNSKESSSIGSTQKSGKRRKKGGRLCQLFDDTFDAGQSEINLFWHKLHLNPAPLHETIPSQTTLDLAMMEQIEGAASPSQRLSLVSSASNLIDLVSKSALECVTRPSLPSPASSSFAYINFFVVDCHNETDAQFCRCIAISERGQILHHASSPTYQVVFGPQTEQSTPVTVGIFVRVFWKWFEFPGSVIICRCYSIIDDKLALAQTRQQVQSFVQQNELSVSISNVANSVFRVNPSSSELQMTMPARLSTMPQSAPESDLDSNELTLFPISELSPFSRANIAIHASIRRVFVLADGQLGLLLQDDSQYLVFVVVPGGEFVEGSIVQLSQLCFRSVRIPSRRVESLAALQGLLHYFDVPAMSQLLEFIVTDPEHCQLVQSTIPVQAISPSYFNIPFQQHVQRIDYSCSVLREIEPISALLNHRPKYPILSATAKQLKCFLVQIRDTALAVCIFSDERRHISIMRKSIKEAKTIACRGALVFHQPNVEIRLDEWSDIQLSGSSTPSRLPMRTLLCDNNVHLVSEVVGTLAKMLCVDDVICGLILNSLSFRSPIAVISTSAELRSALDLPLDAELSVAMPAGRNVKFSSISLLHWSHLSMSMQSKLEAAAEPLDSCIWFRTVTM